MPVRQLDFSDFAGSRQNRSLFKFFLEKYHTKRPILPDSCKIGKVELSDRHYMYAYIYMYTYIHIYIYTYVYMRMYTCAFTHVMYTFVMSHVSYMS